MTIRRTESRIPAGFSAEQLGQAAMKNVTTDSGLNLKLSLISYLSSPIHINSKTTFAVFVEGAPETSWSEWSFSWDISMNVPESKTIYSKSNLDSGIYEFTPTEIGNYTVSVILLHNAMYVDTISLEIFVTESIPVLSRFNGPDKYSKINIISKEGLLAGNDKISFPLLSNYFRYIYEAINPSIDSDDEKIDVPPLFIAALLYQLNVSGYEDGNQKLKKFESSLNRDSIDRAKRSATRHGIGLARLKIPRLAMLINNPETNSPYIPWQELADRSSFSRNDAVTKWYRQIELLKNSLDIKIDLYNLSRFPKSCIRLCALLTRRIIDRPNRWPNINSLDLTNNPLAMKIIATEYYRDCESTPLPPNAQIPEATGTIENAISTIDFGENLVNNTLPIAILNSYFSNNAKTWGGKYGFHNLQLGNKDGNNSYIKELQDNLKEFGFMLIGNSDGDFGLKTEWAVREFQIYARMPFVAILDGTSSLYADNLKSVVNHSPYLGPISGVVNPKTRLAIDTWKSNNWKCPVAISAHNILSSGGRGTEFENKDNVWKHDEIGKCKPNVYAYDLSGWYVTNTENNFNPPSGDNFNLIGMYTKAELGGPVSLTRKGVPCNENNNLDRNHCISKIDTKTLLNIDRKSIFPDSDTTKLPSISSTYKVIRSLAEVECVGYFDSINAYDRAITSIGMYHWTLGRPDKINSKDKVDVDGELCAFLGYLKESSSTEYERYFGIFGIYPDRVWNGNGAAFRHPRHVKYAGWLIQETETKFIPFPRKTENKTKTFDYLHHWHWFYRVTMASRSSSDLQHNNWYFSRIRLRDMLNLRWPQLPETIPDDANSILLKDVFTSEKAIALLLRGHVNLPKKICNEAKGHEGYIVTNGAIAKALERSVNTPNYNIGGQTVSLNWSTPVSTWGDNEEYVLIEKLKLQLMREWHGLSDGTEETLILLDKKKANFMGVYSYKEEADPRIERRPLSNKRKSFSLFFPEDNN